MKNRLIDLKAQYSGLSTLAKRKWDSVAEYLSKQGSDQFRYTTTGFLLFRFTMLRRLTIGLTVVPTPEPIDLTWFPLTFSGSGDVSANQVIATWTPVTVTGNNYVIQATGPVSRSATKPHRSYATMATSGGAGLSQVNFYATWRARFGNIKVGQCIWVRICAQQTNTGFRSPWLYTRIIVGA